MTVKELWNIIKRVIALVKKELAEKKILDAKVAEAKKTIDNIENDR